MTYRTDKLRALGNAVVPQTAALALVTLARRLGVADELGITEAAGGDA